MKKANANKGFSLVELIIVVAIMAILISVLAPQYSRYVERTRLQKDNSAIAEMANAIKIAMADESIYNDTADELKQNYAADTKTISFTVASNAQTASLTTTNKLDAELNAVVGAIKLTSNTYGNATNGVKLCVYINKATGGVEVCAVNWYDSVGGTASAAPTYDASGALSNASAVKIF